MSATANREDAHYLGYTIRISRTEVDVLDPDDNWIGTFASVPSARQYIREQRKNERTQ